MTPAGYLEAMIQKILYMLLFSGLLFPAGGIAATEPPENNKPAPDGPYVLYRGNQILVKSTEMRDTGVIARSIQYNNKSQVLLSCHAGSSDESFSFLLRDTLKNEPDRYAQPAKMLVLSDIEGNFQALKIMLQGARIIDADFSWRFGKGHLVLLGDYFDRGQHVTECLWLIYKLEAEAEKAGGKVHFILGNHEILNLQGVTEYVRGKYLANARLMGEEYINLYDSQSELGRWLRTKNAVEVIGDFVFCHGGISPSLAQTGLSVSDINRISRQYLGRKTENIPAGHAQEIFNTKTGIFWYRDASKNRLSTEQMQEILNFAGAKRMVVGHTLVSDLTAQYGGRLICIDLYHEENLRRGFMKTLWIEDQFCFGIDSRGEKTDVFTVTFPRKQD
jgi:hypothetical protein